MGLLNLVSPGVYTREQDFSLYVPAISTTILAIVTTASKGPVDERTLCTTEEQLISNFGIPSEEHLGLYAAIQYLRQGAQLWVVRVAGYNEGIGQLIIDNAIGSLPACIFTPTSSGSWVNGANGLQIIVSENANIANTYDIIVRWRGNSVEGYDAVNLTDSSSDDYIETRMASSKFCTASVIAGQTTLEEGTHTFAGGNDGSEVTDADYIGTVSGTTRTGLQLFADSEIIDINLIAVPGNSHSSVINELITICETRQDCFALIDPPTGLSVTEVVDWHNGLSGLAYAPSAALNTSYAALYYDWLQAYDSWNAQDLYMPPSGFAAAQMALTDRDYEVWFAPAGYRRGRLPAAKKPQYSPTRGERDYMYGGISGLGGLNRVNPIPNMPGMGVTIWGQSTLQRTPTALDSINVRRSLLFMRKVIATATQYLVFEQNDDRLWNDFKALVRPFLRGIKAGRGLNNFQVVMDASTNPPEVRAQKTAVGYVLLEPTLVAEKILINFSILPQGAQFQEFIQPTPNSTGPG